MLLTTLLGLLSFGLSIQILLVISFIYLNKTHKTKSRFSSELNPVSIIICAHNAAVQLQSNLEFVLQQNLSEFEVIVVNDHSTDQTQAVLEKFQLNFPLLKIIRLNGNHPRKRNALLAGVNASKFEQLLLTDADCKPQSQSWAKMMTQLLSPEYQLVLGLSPYQNKGSWLNKLIQFETTTTAIQYLSFARFKNAYMGVGRNLAVKKSAFLKYNGFENDATIYSGDDDLLVQRFPKNLIGVQDHKKAFCISEPKTNLSDWLRQKQRHYTTAPRYNINQKLELGIIGFSQLAVWSGIIGLAFTNLWWLSLSLIGLLWVLQVFKLLEFKKLVNSNEILLYAPILELNLLILQLYILILNQIKPPQRW